MGVGLSRAKGITRIISGAIGEDEGEGDEEEEESWEEEEEDMGTPLCMKWMPEATKTCCVEEGTPQRSALICMGSRVK